MKNKILALLIGIIGTLLLCGIVIGLEFGMNYIKNHTTPHTQVIIITSFILTIIVAMFSSISYMWIEDK